MSRFLLLSLLLAGCGSAAPTPTAPAEAALTWERQTASGVLTFDEDAHAELSAGWSYAVQTRGPARGVTLRGPEGDLELQILRWDALIDAAPSARARVVEEAWRAQDPTFSLRTEQTIEMPSSTWDHWLVFTYVSPQPLDQALTAFAYIGEDRAYVLLARGTEDSFSRRGAEVNLVATSLTVEGLEEIDWSALPPRPLDEAALAALTQRIEAGRVEAEIPGLAVLIANAEGVIYDQGFGETSEGGEAITGQTRFMIGSMTKFLTSLLAAKLVDAETLRWDTPVHSLLPEFTFASERFTEGLTLQHTLCACTGLPRADLEMIFSYNSPQDVLDLLSTLTPTTEFGETFQYSNQLIDLSGFSLVRAGDAQAPIDELNHAFFSLLDRELLTPLQMERTTGEQAQAIAGSYARPHSTDIAGALHPIPVAMEETVSRHGPAGGLWSTTHDIAQIIALELNHGRVGEGALITEAAMARRLEPQVRLSATAYYGLGAVISAKHQLASYGHDGGTLGYTSELRIFPSLGIGVVVLANRSDTRFPALVPSYMLEAILGVDTRADESGAQLREANALARARLVDSLQESSDAAKQALVGTYTSDSLGEAVITIEGDALLFDAGEWRSRLQRTSGEGDGDEGERWLFLDPPLAGLPIAREGDRLRVLFPQSEHVFRKIDRP